MHISRQGNDATEIDINSSPAVTLCQLSTNHLLEIRTYIYFKFREVFEKLIVVSRVKRTEMNLQKCKIINAMYNCMTSECQFVIQFDSLKDQVK